MRRSAQEDRILAVLKSRGAEWTPAPGLAEISLQYCARVCSLRAQGIAVENRIEIQGGMKRGFYRLAPPSTPHPAAIKLEQPTPQVFPSAGAGSLFGDDDLPERLPSYPD
jgi:hypothetical protein